jgi:hypothetical protein
MRHRPRVEKRYPPDHRALVTAVRYLPLATRLRNVTFNGRLQSLAVASSWRAESRSARVTEAEWDRVS